MIQILIDFWGTVIEFIKPYYYMFWKIILYPPVWIRSFIIILLVIVLMFAVHKIGKLIVRIICKCFQWIAFIAIYIFLDVVLGVCAKIVGSNENHKLLQWEQKASELGKASETFFCNTQKKIKGDKFKLNKKAFFCMVLIYFWLCLPEFSFVKKLDLAYQPIFLLASDTMGKVITTITPEIDLYPDVFDEYEENRLQSETIYLILNERGCTGSNVRSGPSKEADSIGVVMENDTIIYEGLYEKNGDRYWLLISAEGIEGQGWISSYLIEEDCLVQIGL